MRTLAPHGGMLLALALFLAGGLAVLDDYGRTQDEILQRSKPIAAIEFLQGDLGALPPGHNKFYGVAFELPLLLVERAFGLQDVRGVYLSRHLLTHLFFLVGGLFAYFLASRLLHSRLAALYAMLVFLLHPRIYAQSFPSSIDVPFFVLFAVALYLTHRAFRRETLGAFILLGVGVGALANLRIMGVILFAAIPAMHGMDFALARGWAERKRVIAATGVFALSGALTVFALLPYLWADPVGRAVEWWTTLSDHPTKPYELFRGTLYRSDEFPADYVPTWFSITSPPFALAFGLIGAAVVLVMAARSPRIALRSGRLRFGLLLVGCVAAPVAAALLLGANIYNGWRHMYFLWAPFALLAALGLAWLASAAGRARFRAAVYGAAGAGAAMTLISMALIHPNQQVYFNALVDRVAPERLRMQYEMGYWPHPVLQALQWLADNPHALTDNPSVPPHFIQRTTAENIEMLPDAARARIEKNISVDIVQTIMRNAWSRSDRALRRVRVYENTIIAIEPKPDLQAVYEATLGRVPDVDSAFDVHLLDGAVALVMEPCLPSFITQSNVKVRAAPVNRADLPPHREGETDEVRFFELYQHGEFFNGKCVASLPLPGYPVADVVLDWGAPPLDHDVAREAMRRARTDGRLLARAAYDIYITDDELVYVKEPCSPNAAKTLFFFVHIHPRSEDDLPEDQRRERPERRYVKRNHHGALLPDACVALFPLPDYPVAGFQTGQSIGSGDGDLWRASFSANPEPYRAVRRAVASSEPAARSVFDVHLSDGALTYVKEPCEQADTEDRFFLHVVPERADDLPEDRREYGFNGLDFDFFLNGAWFDGKCAARVPLPDYPIASARTGQHISGVREIWSAELALGR